MGNDLLIITDNKINLIICQFLYTFTYVSDSFLFDHLLLLLCRKREVGL